MDSLSEYKEVLSTLGIAVYDTHITSDCMKNGIRFMEFEDFKRFLQANGIAITFGCAYYSSPEDFLITKKILQTELGYSDASNALTFLESELTAYNSSLFEADYDIPSTVIIACNFNGLLCYYMAFNDILLNGEPLADPEEMVHIIYEKNRSNIQQKQSDKATLLEQQKESLRKYVIVDPTFKSCTNKDLRRQYTYDLMRSIIKNNYNALYQLWYRDERIVEQSAYMFIDRIWNELKTK